jgi:hypothetical protein
VKAPYRFVPQGSKFVQLERGTPTGKTYASFEAARAETLRLNDAWRAKGGKKSNPGELTETEKYQDAAFAREIRDLNDAYNKAVSDGAFGWADLIMRSIQREQRDWDEARSHRKGLEPSPPMSTGGFTQTTLDNPKRKNPAWKTVAYAYAPPGESNVSHELTVGYSKWASIEKIGNRFRLTIGVDGKRDVQMYPSLEAAKLTGEIALLGAPQRP